MSNPPEIQLQQLTFIDWEDLEVYFCRCMNIPFDKFRDYHEIVGGEYKDFWHVWVDINSNRVQNNTVIQIWFDMILDEEESSIAEYGNWVEPLFDAITKLQHAVKEEKIYIRYCW